MALGDCHVATTHRTSVELGLIVIYDCDHVVMDRAVLVVNPLIFLELRLIEIPRVAHQVVEVFIFYIIDIQLIFEH